MANPSTEPIVTYAKVLSRLYFHLTCLVNFSSVLSKLHRIPGSLVDFIAILDQYAPHSKLGSPQRRKDCREIFSSVIQS